MSLITDKLQIRINDIKNRHSESESERRLNYNNMQVIMEALQEIIKEQEATKEQLHILHSRMFNQIIP